MKFGQQNTVSKRISRRYGQAIFGQAMEKKNIEDIHKDFLLISSFLEKSPELRDFIADPHHPVELYVSVINEIFAQRTESLSSDFLLFLIQKSRLNLLSEIIAAFLKLYHEHHKIAKIRIVSATKLLPEQIDAICKKLKVRWKQEFLAENIIDPTLIGGFKIKSGDKVLDFSMKSQLETFRRQVINA